MVDLGGVFMNPIKSLKFANLVLFFCVSCYFSGCGGITTPGIPQDSLSAVITANPTSGKAPLEVTLDASESSVAQGNEIVSYEWDFGDGKTGEGQIIQHGFGSPGNYTVILTISDNKGAADTSSVIIKVFQSTETVIEQSFDLQNGIEFDTGTGLKVSVSPVSTVGKAKLVVAENYSPQQLGEGLMKLLSVYSISLIQENISQGQKMDKESSEGPLNVKLMFDISSDTDPNSVVILEWRDEGWVLASSSDSPDSIDSLGGVLASDGHSISIELQHLSTYALSRIEFNWGAPVIFPQVSEPSIITDGDICIDVLLESPHWGIISAGAWYQIEVVNEIGCKSIKSPTDLSFGDWGKNKGFLGPKENKKLQFTFWGTGGTAPIFLSVRDGWPMALRDYLVRVVGGSLDWPYPSREAMENDFIKKLGIGVTSTVLSEAVNKLGDELIKVTSIQDGIRSLWKWMRKYGIGNWASFITTSKLAVDTVGHVLLNQGGYINYRLIGGILPPLVKVNPAEVVINAGESVQFSASLVTKDSNQVLSTNPSSTWGWDVSGGGSIDGNGLFIANNNTSGTYTIKARTGYFGIDGEVHKVEGEANVIINVTGSSIVPPTGLSVSSSWNTTPPGFPSMALSWNAVFGATGYDMWVRSSSGSSVSLGTRDAPYVTFNSNSLPGGARYVSGTTYYFKLRTITVSGTTSAFTSEVPCVAATAPSTSIEQVKLSSPSNGVTLPPGNIAFSWNSVSNATKYQFILYNPLGQVALDTTTSNRTITVALGTEETITWKVRAGDNNGNWGAWSNTWSLTLKSTTTNPVPPTGLSVSSYWNTTSPGFPSMVLSWNAVSGATGYEMWVRPSGGSYASLGTRDVPYVTFNSNSLPGGARYVSGTTYYFKIRTVTASGTSDFTSEVPCVAAAAPSTSLGTIDVFAKLDGSAWIGSLSYSLTGPSSSSGSTVPAVLSNKPVGSYSITFNSGGPPNASLSSITPSNTQTLSAGGIIAFTLNFVTQAPQNVTLILYICENSTSGTPLSGVSVGVVDGGEHSFNQTTNSSGYVTITGTPGTWSFSAMKSGYDTNNWSQSITTNCTKYGYITNSTTTISPPVALSPGSASAPGPVISSLTPTFSWQGVSGADYYRFSISIYPYGTSNIIYTSPNLSTTSFTLPSGVLSNGNKYRWNIKALTNAGQQSDYSNTLYFQTGTITTVPPPPIPLSPGYDSAPGELISTLTPTLKWQTVSNADYYALAISVYPYGTSYIIYNPQKIYGSSITVPSGVLEAGKKYRWNMQSHNSAGWSEVSSTLYFPVASP